MDWRVPLADLDYGQEEEEAVLKVLRSKWLTMGAITQEFEARFSQTVGAKYAIAVSNATEALHLACLALGVGTGDEVITPSLSFVATSNAALYTGAEVSFADVIGPDELTIDPEDIARRVTPRTKAIIVMHYAGYPCRMREILTVADHFGLPVIEDAAHAPGASLDGKAMGTWGSIGCFSFFSNKNLSTGEGGMLVTNRDDVAEKVRLIRSHGMTSLTYDRHHGHAYSYDVVDLGYNYRIDEIRSALGLEQLKKLIVNNAHRKAWSERYWQALVETGVGLPFRGMTGSSSYHILPILLPPDINRKAFMDALRAEGIQTSIHYPPTHRFTYYQSRYGSISLPLTEDISAREVTLPLYPSMGTERVDMVADAIINTIKTMHESE
ncbi:MAG: DegT/DnrJ/EryC1/StrS family aminotransferase [Anaerolineales bacterium]